MSHHHAIPSLRAQKKRLEGRVPESVLLHSQQNNASVKLNLFRAETPYFKIRYDSSAPRVQLELSRTHLYRLTQESHVLPVNRLS